MKAEYQQMGCPQRDSVEREGLGERGALTLGKAKNRTVQEDCLEAYWTGIT